MEQRCKRRKFDKERTMFILFLVFMACYYGWRMFALTPWYDELYTYYYFISRGPVYAAIHWPLPNNHIGYSVLSALLGLFGNPVVALRGISYLSSLGSLVLIFEIGRKCLSRGTALIPVFIYAGMKIVNQLAVQGRGYALVTFCCLTSFYALLRIAAGRQELIRDHLLFGGSLILMLYAIPSSVYVVVPMCLTGGAVLFMQRKFNRLVRLILTSLVSAVCTLGLYGVVWLAIGSNLLVKTEGSACYGMGHADVILHAPFDALGTGIEYMLATPYIQSVGRDGYLHKFLEWMRNLLNEYYLGGAALLTALLLSVIFFLSVRIRQNLKNGRYRQENTEQECGRILEIFLAVNIICIPLMLFVQCALPYYRVFSFAGVIFAFAAAWLCGNLVEYVRHRYAGLTDSGRRLWKYLPGTVSVLCGILCVGLLISAPYRAQYSDREAAIEDAYAQINWEQIERVAVTDCDQEYLLLFLYDMGQERIAQQPEEADAVLADKYLLLGMESGDAGFDPAGDTWKLYSSESEFARFLEESGLSAYYENDRFILFQ